MSKKVKGEIIDLREKVEVEVIKSKFHNAGETILVHPKTAEYFIKHGVAKIAGEVSSKSKSKKSESAE